MRGDGVGIGHVGEVQGNARGIRNPAGGFDRWDAVSERDANLVTRRGSAERFAGIKP